MEKIIHRPRVQRFEYHIREALATGQRPYLKPVLVIVKSRGH